MIDKIIGGTSAAPLSARASGQAAGHSEDLGKKFQEILNNAISQNVDNKHQVEQLNQLFAAGQIPDVHNVLIASEKASLQLELTVQIRNKVIEAYQEIMRTQI